MVFVKLLLNLKDNEKSIDNNNNKKYIFNETTLKKKMIKKIYLMHLKKIITYSSTTSWFSFEKFHTHN